MENHTEPRFEIKIKAPKINALATGLSAELVHQVLATTAKDLAVRANNNEYKKDEKFIIEVTVL